MREVTMEEAMTKAEEACALHLQSFLGCKIYLDANPDNPDCGVFNIGYMYTGEHNAFRASAYHFRGQLELFCRNRHELQRMVMRLLDHFPVNRDCDEGSPLRETSNVMCLRLPIETRAVDTILRTDIQTRKDANPILTYTTTVQFDVVFRCRFD